MNARDYGKKLEELQHQSKTKVEAIELTYNSVLEIKKKIEEYLAQATELNNKITNEETGLQAILDLAVELKSEIVAVKSNAETVYKEIRIFRDNAAGYTKDIENFKDNAANVTQGIQNKYDESVEYKEKIQEIYSIGTKGAHANHFVERRNQLRLMFMTWMIISFIFIVATIYLAVHFVLPMADDMKTSPDINLSAFLLRFSILTPTTFAFIYSLNQYSQERRLYEKYAFKAISTYSIETSLNTLMRSTEGLSDQSRDKKITDFAICTFNSIYQEPIETKKERWSFGVGNKILQLTAETNQTVGKIHQEVDNLKDLAKQEIGE